MEEEEAGRESKGEGGWGVSSAPWNEVALLGATDNETRRLGRGPISFSSHHHGIGFFLPSLLRLSLEGQG